MAAIIGDRYLLGYCPIYWGDVTLVPCGEEAVQALANTIPDRIQSLRRDHYTIDLSIDPPKVKVFRWNDVQIDKRKVVRHLRRAAKNLIRAAA
jgi:hypothetical protein